MITTRRPVCMLILGFRVRPCPDGVLERYESALQRFEPLPQLLARLLAPAGDPGTRLLAAPGELVAGLPAPLRDFVEELGRTLARQRRPGPGLAPGHRERSIDRGTQRLRHPAATRWARPLRHYPRRGIVGVR